MKYQVGLCLRRPIGCLMLALLPCLSACQAERSDLVSDNSTVDVAAAGPESASSTELDNTDSADVTPASPAAAFESQEQDSNQSEPDYRTAKAAVIPEESDQAPEFYTIAHYDKSADPAEHLQATLLRAEEENKTVLLQVGGDWCGWCTRMTNFIAENKAVNELVAENYLIQKVYYDSEYPNRAFLSDYPKIGGYPHLFVLDAKGQLLQSQDTVELEEGSGYSEQAFVSFLNTWKPSSSH